MATAGFSQDDQEWRSAPGDFMRFLEPLPVQDGAYTSLGLVLVTTPAADTDPEHLAAQRGEIVRIERVRGSQAECTNARGETGWLPSAYMELSVLTSRHIQAGLLAPPNPPPQGASTTSGPVADSHSKNAAPQRKKAPEGAAGVERWQETAEIALEQLANFDPYPYLDFAAAEIMLLHQAATSEDAGNGSYLLWRPDGNAAACRSLLPRNLGLHRGFTALVLSFVEPPYVVEHKLVWRVGGEDGYTCWPAGVWQKYHGAVVLLQEPWLCNDARQLLARHLLFPSVGHLVQASPNLTKRIHPSHCQPAARMPPATDELPGLWGGVGAGMGGDSFQHEESYTWRSPNLALEQLRVARPEADGDWSKHLPSYVPEIKLNVKQTYFFAQHQARLQRENAKEADESAKWTALFRARMQVCAAKVEEAQKLATKLVAHPQHTDAQGCGRLTAEEADELGGKMGEGWLALKQAKDALLLSRHLDMLYPMYKTAEEQLRYLDTALTSAQEEGMIGGL